MTMGVGCRSSVAGWFIYNHEGWLKTSFVRLLVSSIVFSICELVGICHLNVGIAEFILRLLHARYIVLSQW